MKVLVVGSGPIVIGQAAEFDYAGTQACKALREEGVTSVLVNSNPATIMTDEGIADVVYIEPLTLAVVSRIIERERPDGLLPTLGGQTGLNLAVELAEAGVLDRFGVRLLGTPLPAIRQAEDRQLFRDLLERIGEPVPPSAIVENQSRAREAAAHLGLPLVVRPAYTLGGTGGGIARTEAELDHIVRGGLAASPIHQVLLETSLLGWKEVEYEVMRDGADNCVTICNMENLDPMGVHTGDSIVVAPSQTLTDREYQLLRSASLRIIRALGIEGGCNVQFGLAPSPIVAAAWLGEGKAGRWPDWKRHGPGLPEYYVIEVNPRVSRSSALASKATGYPIARVAAKIAVGKTLDQIPNAVTERTTAAFEPALDYCVVKVPRWPFDKFAGGDRLLGTQMKATGEVMAIERQFEGALQKAVRSLEFGRRSILWEDRSWTRNAQRPDVLAGLPLEANDLRLWALLAALRRGATTDELAQASGIDPWFLTKFQSIVDLERRLLREDLTRDLLRDAKRRGFSDEDVATLADRLPEQVRRQRQEWGIRPTYKMVDTCAAEFDAATPYFYSSYDRENEAICSGAARKALVIGSGPIRIGQGIEFDYCSVHSAWALQEAGFESLMVNSNPETVSTDFDSSTRLYFEPLDEESIRDLLESESGAGAPADAPAGDAAPAATDVDVPTIAQFGGQTAINLVGALHRAGLPILGSSAEAVDLAEDRRRFEDFLNRLGIPQPPGAAVTSVEQALAVAARIDYPVLVRPSYVLGGRAMEIVGGATDLIRYVTAAAEVAEGRPVLVDKYLLGREVEVDAICDGERVLIPGIIEHIERAGVHSGDSMALYPPRNLSAADVATLVEYTTRIALELGVRGLVNIQYVITQSEREPHIFVLEVNPRASRTVPFLAKVTGVPIVRVATHAILGRTLREQGYDGGLWPEQPLVAIKAPVFSMSKLGGVDTYLGPEMKSTGEVMGIDVTFDAASAKALSAAGLMLPPTGAMLLSVADKDKAEAIPLVRELHARGYRLHATEGTAAMIDALGLPVTMTTKKLDEGHPNVVDIVEDGTVCGVINTMTGGPVVLRDGFYIRRAAVEARIPCFTSLDTARAAIAAVGALAEAWSIQPLTAYRDGR